MKRLMLMILTASIVFLFAMCTSAEVPHLIRFQGKVTDKAGAPLNGAYNITFRIYNAETGGSLLWSETQAVVPVNNGIFSALLGNVASLNLPFDAPYWLSMEVNDDGEMAPRQAITSVGYAIHAEVADSIANVSVVPQGAIIIWRGDSCPVGYTRVAELDGKFIVGGANYNPAAGGSNTHRHGVGSYKVENHTLTIDEMPSHSHTYGTDDWTEQGTVYARMAGGAEREASPSTDPKGGGQPHNHPFSGTTAPADSRPEFATVIFCQKD